MNAQEMLLLRSLNSALELKPSTNTLLADEVNGLGATIGLNGAETLHLIEALKEAGFLELNWPGRISVTRKGRSALNQANTSGDQISLGPGAVYVKNSQIGAGAAVGSNAMAAGAVKIARERPPVHLEHTIAELIAAHQHLVREHSMLPPSAQDLAQQLTEETYSIQQEMRNPTPDKISVEQRLDRAKGFLEKLGGVAAAAATLKPALEFLHRSFDWLTNYLRSIGS
ncbi:MAG TPA: hypothetical protein VJW20_01980 [Candidatus Angelobacter sp.]|nr:hypothetical protein [Candidatus Angelobacter sp.]